MAKSMEPAAVASRAKKHAKLQAWQERVGELNRERKASKQAKSLLCLDFRAFIRSVAGGITRLSNPVRVVGSEAMAHTELETVYVWRETAVYWKTLADGSAYGLAPLGTAAAHFLWDNYNEATQ